MKDIRVRNDLKIAKQEGITIGVDLMSDKLDDAAAADIWQATILGCESISQNYGPEQNSTFKPMLRN